jgi:hypothetical protein
MSLSARHSEARLRAEFARRARVKRALDGGAVALGLCALAAIAVNALGYFEPLAGVLVPAAVTWCILYAALAVAQSRLWRCPGCEHPLAKWNEPALQPPPQACRHCGLKLIEAPQAVPAPEAELQAARVRPGFALTIAAGMCSWMVLSPERQTFVIGGATLVLLAIATLGASSLRRTACRGCGKPGQRGRFCERCGAPT